MVLTSALTASGCSFEKWVGANLVSSRAEPKRERSSEIFSQTAREQNGVKTTADAGPRSCSSSPSPDTGTSASSPSPQAASQRDSVCPQTLAWTVHFCVGHSGQRRVAAQRTPVRTLSDDSHLRTPHSQTVDRLGHFGRTAGTPRRPIDETQITAGRQTVDGPEMRFVSLFIFDSRNFCQG